MSLTMPTNGAEPEILILQKGEISPYAGVVVPSAQFRDYHACTLKLDVCLDNIPLDDSNEWVWKVLLGFVSGVAVGAILD